MCIHTPNDRKKEKYCVNYAILTETPTSAFFHFVYILPEAGKQRINASRSKKKKPTLTKDSAAGTYIQTWIRIC